jgi:ubiquinone biosynthesis protein COQ9
MSDLISETELAQQPPYLRFRYRLLAAMLERAAFESWSRQAMRAAAADAGLSEGEAELAAPNGPIDLIDALELWADDQMVAGLSPADVAAMKVRARITLAVSVRLEALGPYREAVRRAAGASLLPWRATNPPRFVWRSADRIWTTLQDPSTDWNWYSKRTVLAGVLASTFLAWLAADDDASWRAFLDRRIEGVMQFEKAKSTAKAMMANMPDVADVLSRMRYGRG